jgi:hypothetical protein
MKYLLFIFLFMAAVITAGCVGENQNSPVTPTPQVVTVNPAPTVAVPAARYTVGDIVWRNESNYNTETHRSRGIIVLRINASSYESEYVSKDDGTTGWYREYPNNETSDIASFEMNYPRKVEHASTITSLYATKNEFDDAIAEAQCCLIANASKKT